MVSKLTEIMMGDAFEKYLNKRGSNNGLPAFSYIYREVSCKQGVADFIAVVSPSLKEKHLRIFNDVTNKVSESSIILLSLLRHSTPRTENHLIEKSGYTYKTVSRILNGLVKQNAVRVTESGSFLLSPEWCPPPLEIWAFELKMNDWKRALFQALQCKAFSSYVLTIFPSDRAKVLNDNIGKFRRMKVGIMLFNPKDNKFEMLLCPIKDVPSSRMHYLYAVKQITSLTK